MNARIPVLLVMPRERRLGLLEQLQGCSIELLAACDCREARRIMEAGRTVRVVLTDVSLTDGNWRDVLTIALENNTGAVIVCAPAADLRLWREVSDSAAYDLLIPPYEDVKRVVERAAVTSYMRSLRPARATGAVANSYIPEVA